MRVYVIYFLQHDKFYPPKDCNTIGSTTLVFEYPFQRWPLFNRYNSIFNKAVNSRGWRLPANRVKKAEKSDQNDKAKFHSNKDKHCYVIYYRID